MSRTPPKLVIDARPQGPSGPIAEARVQGRPVLDHLLDLVERVGDPAWTVPVHAREAEHPRLARLLDARPSTRFRLALGPPPEDAVILRSDRFYDPDRLRKAIRSGTDPESAVVWRIDRPGALGAGPMEDNPAGSDRSADASWTRRPAWALARLLAPTGVRPAMLAVASAGLTIGAGASIAAGRGTFAHQLLPAAALAGSMILDAARAPLGKLRGPDDGAGRWLDANLKELADLLLHAAIAWSAFVATGRIGWLMIGLAYTIARGLDRFGAFTAVARTPRGAAGRLADRIGRGVVRRQVGIVLAAAGWTPIGLAAYGAYFAGRALARGIEEGATHGA